MKLTYQHNALHWTRWRLVQVPLMQYGLPHYDAALADLYALELEAITRQRATAQPKPRFYEVLLKESAGRN